MKALMVAGFMALALPQIARADCWNECIARNPLNGGCVARTKVCNVEDAERAAQSLGSDVHKGYQRLQSTWHGLYGQVPPYLRHVLNRYPITIATVVYPGTREYAMVAWTIEKYFNAAESRAQEVQPVYQTAPDWKKLWIVRAQGLLLEKGGLEILGITDWNAPEAQSAKVEYEEQWTTFVNCIDAAQSNEAGLACYRALDASSAAL